MPSNSKCLGLKIFCFWHLHLWLWHISCNFKTVQFLFKSHQAEFDIADRCPCEHLAFLTNDSPLVIYLLKSCDFLRPQTLQIPLITLTTFCVGVHFFIYIFIYCITIMTTSNAPSVCYLYYWILFVIGWGTSFDNIITFLSRFEKVKFNIYIYIHIILAQKLFKLVICSGEIVSLWIKSPKLSSTLNWVFFMITFLLSRYIL